MSKPFKKIVVTFANRPTSVLLKPLAQYLHTLALESALIDKEPQTELLV